MTTRKPPRTSWILPALAVALLFTAACSGGGSDSPTNPTGFSLAEVEFLSFDLANGARREHSLDALSGPDNLVAAVARAHSEAMRDEGFFGHSGSSGGLQARLRAAGVEFSAAGENLAKVSSVGDPAGTAHSLFLNSSDHRSVMLDAGFELAGVGVARNGDTYWLTQIYVSR